MPDVNLNPRAGGKDEEIRAEVLRVVEEAGRRLYVVAPSWAEFNAWRSRFAWGINPRFFRAVFEARDVQGLYKPPYVVVNDWPTGLRGIGVFQHMQIVGGVKLADFYT